MFAARAVGPSVAHAEHAARAFANLHMGFGVALLLALAVYVFSAERPSKT